MPSSSSPPTLRRRSATIFILVLSILDLAAAELSYHTLGEVPASLFFALCAVNLGLVALAQWVPRTAAMASLLLASLIVPYQTLLGFRWLEIRSRAALIVDYAIETKARTGEYPSDLSSLPCPSPFLRQHVEYRLTADGSSFGVSYWVGTRSTSHWYVPETGWGYYPD